VTGVTLIFRAFCWSCRREGEHEGTECDWAAAHVLRCLLCGRTRLFVAGWERIEAMHREYAVGSA
jgi:hypothetical protein